MKKNKSLFPLLAIFLFWPVWGFVAAVGNPAGPSMLQEGFAVADDVFINLKFGVENTYINNEKLKFRQKFENLDFKKPITSGFSAVGSFALNIKERLELYGKAGILRFAFDFQREAIRYQALGKNGLFLQGGGRAVIFEVKDLSLGADVRYLVTEAQAQSLTLNGAAAQPGALKFYFKGWQLGAGISYQTEILCPFIGVVYRFARLKMKHASFFPEEAIQMGQRHRGGMYLGATVSSHDTFLLEIELRLINEKSATATGVWRF